MIRDALSLLSRELNASLQRRFRLEEEAALISSLVDQDGSVPERNKNRVIISLIHLEQETNRPYNQRHVVDAPSDRAFRVTPPIKFNLNFVCASYFADYEESLKFLSESVAFFQDRSYFDAGNTANFPSRLERLNLEVLNIDLTAFHNIWTALGAKYAPSVLYKARLLAICGDSLGGQDAMVSAAEPNVH